METRINILAVIVISVVCWAVANLAQAKPPKARCDAHALVVIASDMQGREWRHDVTYLRCSGNAAPLRSDFRQVRGSVWARVRDYADVNDHICSHARSAARQE